MCIIIYKPKNTELPSESTLYECFFNNPDGSGIMFNDGKNVIIKKGFMNYNLFLTELYNIDAKYNLFNKDLVLHFRIATQGNINKQNCHPFPLSSETKDLIKTSIKTDTGIAHNGIIYFCELKASKLSDTQIFIKHYLTELDYLNPIVQNLIKHATNSKFAIMTKNQAYLIGDFIIEKDSCYYSNNSYLPYMLDCYDLKYNNNYSIKYNVSNKKIYKYHVK